MVELGRASVLSGVDSRLLYTGVVGLVAVERLIELIISRRHAERALRRGAVESGREHYRVMVLLHAAFLIAGVAEVWLLGRPLLPPLTVVMAVLLVASMALRYWAIGTLGERWSTRVICEPGRPAIRRGPYRFLRHPNYLAVVVELVALPLLHTAWLTAVVFSLLNARLLQVRIGVEEAALRRFCEYDASFQPGGKLT